MREGSTGRRISVWTTHEICYTIDRSSRSPWISPYRSLTWYIKLGPCKCAIGWRLTGIKGEFANYEGPFRRRMEVELSESFVWPDVFKKNWLNTSVRRAFAKRQEKIWEQSITSVTSWTLSLYNNFSINSRFCAAIWNGISDFVFLSNWVMMNCLFKRSCGEVNTYGVSNVCN